MLFIEIESRQFKVPYYQAVVKSMKLVLNSLSSENQSGNPVQLSGLQESSCVEDVSPGSEIAHRLSQFQTNSGGKSMSSHLLQMGWPNG